MKTEQEIRERLDFENGIIYGEKTEEQKADIRKQVLKWVLE